MPRDFDFEEEEQPRKAKRRPVDDDDEPPRRPRRRAKSNGLTTAGGVLFVLGALAGFIGFGFNTTRGEVHNIGLLVDRLAWLISGAGMAVCGSVLIAAGSVLDGMKKL